MFPPSIKESILKHIDEQPTVDAEVAFRAKVEAGKNEPLTPDELGEALGRWMLKTYNKTSVVISHKPKEAPHGNAKN